MKTDHYGLLDILHETINRNLMHSITHIVFKMGMVYQIDKDGFNALNECEMDTWNTPSWHLFEFKWVIYNGILRISFTKKEHKNHQVRYVGEIRVLGQKENHLISDSEFPLKVVIPYENIIFKTMPGITILNSLRSCESKIHNDIRAPKGTNFCVLNGDQWQCEACATWINQKMVLPEPHLLSQDERAKMTAKLRFQILERDGFRCRACGADPRSDETVKLHVDHIHPIAKGGKTEINNLQILCSRCNLAKSDQIVEQMKLWEF